MTRLTIELDPETLVEAYCRGVFPMTDQDGQVRWYTADPRGIIPLDDRFHVPQSLAQFMRSASFPFEVRVNHDFQAAMRACMDCRPGATWISDELIAAYMRLHKLKMAHSVEVWHGDKLAGGLYGVSVGAAFFGESMFHYERDASKVALVHLVSRLRGTRLSAPRCSGIHAPFERFGCVEVPAEQYLRLLHKAVRKPCTFA